MICCDCCKEPITNSSRLTLSWMEENPPDNPSGYGTLVFNKSHEYDLCDKCRESLIKCLGKGPIWEFIQRIDREYAELKCEFSAQSSALQELGKRYKELKEKEKEWKR